MRLLLSPYELSASSPAAAAAMLLGEDAGGVLTVQPSPFDTATAEAARELAMAAPSFGRLLEQWRWTGPLWRGGLLRAAGTGRALAEMMQQRRMEMSADPMLVSARHLLSTGEIDDEPTFIESLSRDLIRGGSDPSVSLPLVAVAERLAVDSESALICGESAGLIWKPRVGSAAALSFAMPLPLGASGGEILEWREALAAPLGTLRETLREAVARVRSGVLNGHATAVRLAAESYADAFRARHATLGRDASERFGGRPIEAVASLSVCTTGHAIREAVARLARMAPSRFAGDETRPGTAVVQRPRPIPIVRVKSAAWDFGPSR